MGTLDAIGKVFKSGACTDWYFSPTLDHQLCLNYNNEFQPHRFVHYLSCFLPLGRPSHRSCRAFGAGRRTSRTGRAITLSAIWPATTTDSPRAGLTPAIPPTGRISTTRARGSIPGASETLIVSGSLSMGGLRLQRLVASAISKLKNC